MYIKAYCLDSGKSKGRRGFLEGRSLDFAERRGGVSYDEYTLFFEGEVDAKNLEDVYLRFNTQSGLPEGYHGRGLFVSDVVVVKDRAFYLDNLTFAEIQNFRSGNFAHKKKKNDE